MRYVARAPLRVDFGGGWTDVPFFAEAEGGAVLNAAITVYVRGSISRPDQTGVIKTLRGDRSHLNYSLDAPSGAGLGASAAQTVLWATLVKTTISNSSSRADIAEIACKVKELLGIVGGKQDEYASALGGIGFYRFSGNVIAERLSLDATVVQALRDRLVLVYTGKCRISSDIHDAVWSRYRAGDPTVVSALRELRAIAEEMKIALETRDLDSFGRLMDENWRRQRLLHPSVADPTLDAALELGARNSAVGGKACGAGGGGCAIFLAAEGRTEVLKTAFTTRRLRVIEFDFDTYGVHLNKG